VRLLAVPDSVAELLRFQVSVPVIWVCALAAFNAKSVTANRRAILFFMRLAFFEELGELLLGFAFVDF